MTQSIEAGDPPRNVSRETENALQRYVTLLEKWSRAINLVAPGSLGQVWDRHIHDSAQLLPLLRYRNREASRSWCDMGSGAGFPGLVTAILAVDHYPDLHVTLVESDARKCAFLRQASAALNLSVTVRRARIEALPSLRSDVISARALAPLDRLLHCAEPHLVRDGLCIFPKGERWQEEVETALASWRFRLHHYPSATDPRGAILTIEDLHRA